MRPYNAAAIRVGEAQVKNHKTANLIFICIFNAFI